MAREVTGVQLLLLGECSYPGDELISFVEDQRKRPLRILMDQFALH
jgi:hypothetical protein